MVDSVDWEAKSAGCNQFTTCLDSDNISAPALSEPPSSPVTANSPKSLQLMALYEYQVCAHAL